jgi:hypothetical protein
VPKNKIADEAKTAAMKTNLKPACCRISNQSIFCETNNKNTVSKAVA